MVTRGWRAVFNSTTDGVKADSYGSPALSEATTPRPLLASPANHVAVQVMSPVRKTAPTGPSLRFQDVTLTLRDKTNKTLVHGISGVAQSGRVLAILGPSGAGKTTLLNAISGRAPYAKIAGSVSVGGETLSSAELSYVPQFDCLNLQLTIEQTFVTTAQLQRTDMGVGMATVNELMDVLSLAEKRHHLVSTLSSGERKRPPSASPSWHSPECCC